WVFLSVGSGGLDTPLCGYSTSGVQEWAPAPRGGGSRAIREAASRVPNAQSEPSPNSRGRRPADSNGFTKGAGCTVLRWWHPDARNQVGYSLWPLGSPRVTAAAVARSSAGAGANP